MRDQESSSPVRACGHETVCQKDPPGTLTDECLRSSMVNKLTGDSRMKQLTQFRVKWTANGRVHISEFAAHSASEAQRAMEAYKFPGVRVVSVEPLGPAASTAAVPGHPSVSDRGEVPDLPDYWNACLEVISRPIETLNAIQRPVALVFKYYGHVENGGHSSHFDACGDSSDPELLQALRDIGAAKHARILADCYFLRQEAKRSRREEDYASETIADLDRQFGRLRPDIPELLARYFESHPDSFPVTGSTRSEPS